MSNLNLKDHINSSLKVTDTTGIITGPPWTVGSPNIHQPWHPSPSDIRAREWEKMIREMNNVSVNGPAITSDADRMIFDPPTSRNRTLKFKEVVFVVYLPDEAMEFFEDDREVTRDELRLLQIAHPTEYSKIKKAWTNAWKELKALEAFEKD